MVYSLLFVIIDIFKEIQLVFTEIQFRRHTIFVVLDKPLDVFLYQIDGRSLARLAVVFERFVLPLRQLERYRVILVTSVMVFLHITSFA